MENDTTMPDSADTESEAPKRGRRAKTEQVITPDTAADTGDTTTAKTTSAAKAKAGAKADDAEDKPQKTTRARKTTAKAEASEDSSDEAAENAGASESASDDSGDQDAGGRGRGRGRGRDRRRGRNSNQDDVDPEISDDDVLIPIGGILDVLDNYAFVRTTGYLPGPTDIYVSLGQVKKYNLRKGDAVIGSIRQPREGELQGRQKYNALVSVDTINAQSVDEAQKRPEFGTLTAIQPTKRLSVAGGSEIKSMGLVDLFAPLAMGQRGIIVAPPKSGKSTMVQRLAEAIAANHPDVHLMVVLVDENPETVTELQRSVKGEVIASTFDRPADDHTTIAELAIERAKRLVELGHDVVVIFDSVTRLARAYQLTGTHSRGSQQADASWLYPTKRLVGAGRQVEGGGSLTILGTLLAETGQAIDDQVAHEVSQLATVELVLSAEASRARLFPAIDVVRSGTSRDEALMGQRDATVMDEFRRHALHADPVEVLGHLMALADKASGTEDLVEKLRNSPVEFRQGA